MSEGSVELHEVTFRITAPDVWESKPYRLRGVVEHIGAEYEILDAEFVSLAECLVTIRFDSPSCVDLRPLIDIAARIDELLREYGEEPDA